MTTISANTITLHDLETKFNLALAEDKDSVFFPEWQTELAELDPQELMWLDRMKISYNHLTKYPTMAENAVQLTVLSPLLHLSDFLLPPFVLKTESSVTVTTTDDDICIEGRIDILMLKDKVWALVIESKRAEVAIKVGFAQILAYMLATPTPNRPCYGLVTNGGSFVFIKLVIGDVPRYSMSRVFDLVNPGNDLYAVLQVLKKIRDLA